MPNLKTLPAPDGDLRSLGPHLDRLRLAVLMGVLFSAVFYATDHHMESLWRQGGGFWSPLFAWDDRIPFVPAWIWVYLLYFPACFLPLTIREIRDDEETFRRTALGFAVQFGVSFFIFWLVPSHILRPEIGAGGASNGALRWLYALDPGFNVFPSLHVANVAYVACLIGRLRGAATAAPVWFLWVLIAGSTLLIKQHFLVDVAAGTFLGIFSCSLAFHADLFRARVPAPVVLAANLAADVPPIA